MWKTVIAPTIIVSVFWLVVSGAVTYFTYRVYESNRRTLEEDVATIEAAVGMRENLVGLQTVLAESREKVPHQSQAEAEALETAFLKYFKEGEDTSFTPPEKVLSKTIGENFRVFQEYIRRHRNCSRPASRRSPARIIAGKAGD